MIISMTGYGRAQAAGDIGTVTAEIKSVNSRFLEINIRGDIPAAADDAARTIIKKNLARGKVNLNISFTRGEAGKKSETTVNTALLDSYIDVLSDIRKRKEIKKGKIELRDLLHMPVSFIDVTEERASEESLIPLISEAVEGAVSALLDMRRREGEHLKEDLSARLDFLAGKLETLKASQQNVEAAYETRLRERISKLLGDLHTEIDEGRILQEVALYSEKTDYTEELVRFESHIGQFRDTLAAGGEVGRKLDFLLQELNREVNTLGSKAGETDVVNDVIVLKTELEKIREQVQNLE